MTFAKSVQSVFKTPTHHALTRNIRVLRKIIRVIRAIRVQNPYAPRYDIVLRVPG